MHFIFFLFNQWEWISFLEINLKIHVWDIIKTMHIKGSDDWLKLQLQMVSELWLLSADILKWLREEAKNKISLFTQIFSSPFTKATSFWKIFMKLYSYTGVVTAEILLHLCTIA